MSAACKSDDPRRLIIPRNGAPEVMRVESYTPAAPGPGEARVRVHYAGINFADLMMRLGLYRPKPKMPFTPGYEGSGVVEALGEGVGQVEIGQRVVFVVPAGAQQTHLNVPASQLIPLPDELSLERAAAIPVTYLTAWHMLVHLGNLRAGETVLIHGIAGGVGTAALQIAKLRGAGEVFGTASASKAERVEASGARFLERENFTQQLREQTNGRGADHILDAVGGAHLQRSYRALADGGRLYSFGLSAAAPGARFNPLAAIKALWGMRRFSVADMMLKNRGVLGVHMGTFGDQALLKDHLSAILQEVERGSLDPQIDAVFPLEKSVDAHHHIHARRNYGKVLLGLDSAGADSGTGE